MTKCVEKIVISELHGKSCAGSITGIFRYNTGDLFIESINICTFFQQYKIVWSCIVPCFYPRVYVFHIFKRKNEIKLLRGMRRRFFKNTGNKKITILLKTDRFSHKVFGCTE